MAWFKKSLKSTAKLLIMMYILRNKLFAVWNNLENYLNAKYFWSFELSPWCLSLNKIIRWIFLMDWLKNIAQLTNISYILVTLPHPIFSSMFDLTTGSLNSTPTRSPVKSSHSPPKRHISPQKSSQIHSCRPPGGDHCRDSIRDKSEVVTLESHHQSVVSVCRYMIIFLPPCLHSGLHINKQ